MNVLRMQLWLGLVIVTLGLGLGCRNSNSSVEALADSLQTQAAEFEEQNAGTQVGILLQIAHEFEGSGQADSAMAQYLKAQAKCGKCAQADSIAKAIARLRLPAPVQDPLLGEHVFGVQFIWDGYGKATIIDTDGKWTIQGSQFSKDKGDFVKISGEVTVQDDRQFTVTGEIQTAIKDCCGDVTHKGRFTFRRTGDRKFYRLQEREQFCGMHTCHYYIDLFI
jgi:hypothetical protein